MQAKYDRRQMVRLICEGLSSYQIAARLHVTPSTVRKAARQLKQQQAGTYKPKRSFYSERLIDLVPKRTKIDDAKSATVKANRLPLIKEAIAKRNNRLPVADAAVPVFEFPAIHCGEHCAVAEFGSGRVLQTVTTDSVCTDIQVLRLTALKTPHLHSSVIGGRWISLRFRNRPAVQSLIDHLNQLMKGFDQ